MHVASAAHGRTAVASAAGVHPNLAGAADLPFVELSEAVGADADILFSCLPSGRLGPLVEDVAAPAIVDLSDEHRAKR